MGSEPDFRRFPGIVPIVVAGLSRLDPAIEAGRREDSGNRRYSPVGRDMKILSIFEETGVRTDLMAGSSRAIKTPALSPRTISGATLPHAPVRCR